MRVAVTGASGFVGGRLVPALRTAGHEVRALTRRPAAYRGLGRPVAADVHDADSLAAALAGCDAAYYLVHELGDPDLVRREQVGARTFGRAAADAGLRQVVYLGGLAPTGEELSPHLRSRRLVEDSLRTGGVPVTAVRAGIVLGPGSLAWELLRQLVAATPLMVAPVWARSRCQVIAADDLVGYLLDVLGDERLLDATLEVGCDDLLSYREILEGAARALRRPVVLVEAPALPAVLQRWALDTFTDVDTAAVLALLESMRHDAVVHDDSARRLLPRRPMGFARAVARAIVEQDRLDAGAP